MIGGPAKALILATLALLGARANYACSCIGPNPVCSAYWKTDILFLGHVVRIDHVYDEPPEERIVNGKTITIVGPGQNLIHFDVKKVYRSASSKESPGNACTSGCQGSEQFVIHTADQSSACGYAFKVGVDYLVYASIGANGELATSHCTRTHEVVRPEDDADLRWIGGLPQSPAGASIFGQVQTLQPNESGGYESSGLAHIAVSIKGPDSKTVSSDADGKFRADGLAPGKYVVSAIAPNRYAPFTDSTVTLQDRACAEIPWTTRLDGHIRGHVYFSDGTPAGGLYLATKAADAVPHDSTTWKSSYATTGPDGAFDFAGLSPGMYVFGVNLDFTGLDGKTYYRRAFFPGSSSRSEAATISVGAGETVNPADFVLPADSPPPSIKVAVQVLGFDGRPVPHAQIIAADAMWENSVTPVMATADESGRATIMLRPSSRYDIGAYVNLPDFTQACAEPEGVDAHDEPAPLVLKLSHPFGNCMQFKKPSTK